MTIENFNTQNFQQDVLSSSEPIMIDFWAPWCSHCRNLNPVLEEYASSAPVRVGKVNVDEAPELASQFKIMTIPTVAIFKDGKIQKKKIAPQEIEDLEAMVQ